MKLSTLLLPPRIVLGLKARNLTEAVIEILDSVERFRPDLPIVDIANAVLNREAQGSTLLERGIAVPHARISGLRDFDIMLGITAEPLEDTCLDGSPVDMVFLILANNEKNTLMLQSLAAIGNFAMNLTWLEELRGAGSREAAWNVIHESGVQVKKGLFARDLMHKAKVVASKDMTLSELLDAFFSSGVNEAPVCDDKGKVVGAVTSKEIIEAGFPDYMSRMRGISFLNEYGPFEEFFKREATIKVGDIHNSDPLIVDGGDPMIQVVFRMRGELKRLAFVEEDGRFAGIVDRNDIVLRILRA